MSGFNRQRTIYMTEEDYQDFLKLGELLEAAYPRELFRVRNEISLSAVMKFCAQQKLKELTNGNG